MSTEEIATKIQRESDAKWKPGPVPREFSTVLLRPVGSQGVILWVSPDCRPASVFGHPYEWCYPGDIFEKLK